MRLGLGTTTKIAGVVSVAISTAAAATAVLAACSTSTTGRGSGSGTPSVTPGSTSASAASSAASSAAASTPPASSSGSASTSADWASHTDFSTAAHPGLDCSSAGLGGRVDVLKVVVADVTGHSFPEAIVRLQCAHSASEWPDWVYVYANLTGTPTVIGTLIKGSDNLYVPTITPGELSVTLGELGWSTYAPGCCPDLHYTQTFTWNGGGFTAGPRTGVVAQCADTALTVAAGGQQGATGHSSIVLLFTNRLPIACTIRGYPGLDALSSSGGVLAHATRTMSGFAGGAHAIDSLTVAPGQTVSALAEWLNFNPATSGPCTTSASVAVTPANTADTVPLPLHVTVCGLQIHPTVAGSSGRN